MYINYVLQAYAKKVGGNKQKTNMSTLLPSFPSLFHLGFKPIGWCHPQPVVGPAERPIIHRDTWNCASISRASLTLVKFTYRN